MVEKAIHTYNVQHATIEHADTINIFDSSTVESVLSFVIDQQKRKDEEKKEKERKQREVEEKQREAEEKQREAEEKQREAEEKQREAERKKKEESDKHSLIGLLMLFLVVFILIASSYFFSPEEQKRIEIPINYSSTELAEKNYQDVVVELRKNGFINIKTEPKKDLVFGWLTKDGEVEHIEINGIDEFSRGTKFPEDARIIVTYHTFILK
jgi:Fe2+ transport system protein B